VKDTRERESRKERKTIPAWKECVGKSTRRTGNEDVWLDKKERVYPRNCNMGSRLLMSWRGKGYIKRYRNYFFVYFVVVDFSSDGPADDDDNDNKYPWHYGVFYWKMHSWGIYHNCSEL